MEIITYLKPIPKYIENLIFRLDKKLCREQKGLRFYSYLTTIKKQLIKVTVAIRNRRKKERLIKQVAIHGLNCDKCFVRDLEYCYLGICGYRVGWYDEGIKYRYGLRPFYNDGIWYDAPDKYYDPYAPVINPKYALKYFPYSVADKYPYPNILKYLRVYEKYPKAEYLLKLGLYRLATFKTILGLLDKNKSFRRWIIQHRNELAKNYYFAETIITAFKNNNSLDKTQTYLRKKKSFIHEKDYEPLKELFKGKLLERFFSYIEEQHTSYRTYLDYLSACNYLKLDMTLEKNRFPHDFKKWHDIRIDEYCTAKAIEDEKTRKKLYKSFAAVSDKYLPLQHNFKGNYICVIARSPAELIKEGTALHHCVGHMGYDQKMIREESLIFFIRNISEPDKPFVTMEYSLASNRVIQCYATNNTKPNNAVMEFINNKWLPYAKKALKKIAA